MLILQKKKIVFDFLGARKYIFSDLGKKWRENRHFLWGHYDKTKSREENILNPPENVIPDQWVCFVDYRLDPKTQVVPITLMLYSFLFIYIFIQ